jgi:hypothetical protein
LKYYKGECNLGTITGASFSFLFHFFSFFFFFEKGEYCIPQINCVKILLRKNNGLDRWRTHIPPSMPNVKNKVTHALLKGEPLD